MPPPVASGGCLQGPSSLVFDQLNLCCGQGTPLKATPYERHRAGTARTWAYSRSPTDMWITDPSTYGALQVRCRTDHFLKSQSQPRSQAPPVPTGYQQHLSSLQGTPGCRNWGPLVLPMCIQTTNTLEVRAKETSPVKTANLCHLYLYC